MFGIKQYLYIGVGVIAIVGLTALGWKLYQAGKDAERVEIYKALEKQREEQDKKLKTAIDQALDEQAKQFLVARQRAVHNAIEEAKGERQVITVTNEVEKIVYRDKETGCTELDLSYIKLWNDSTTRGNAYSIGGEDYQTEGRSNTAGAVQVPEADFAF